MNRITAYIFFLLCYRIFNRYTVFVLYKLKAFVQSVLNKIIILLIVSTREKDNIYLKVTVKKFLTLRDNINYVWRDFSNIIIKYTCNLTHIYIIAQVRTKGEAQWILLNFWVLLTCVFVYHKIIQSSTFVNIALST